MTPIRTVTGRLVKGSRIRGTNHHNFVLLKPSSSCFIRSIHHLASKTSVNNGLPSVTSSSPSLISSKAPNMHTQFGSFSICCLVDAPWTMIPSDISRLVCRITGDADCLARSFVIPDLLGPWTLQSHLLFFTNPTAIYTLGQALVRHPTKRILRVNKYPAGYTYFRALCSPKTGLPPVHPWSGRTVLIRGIPSKLPWTHVEQSLLSFGLPIIPAGSLEPHHRAQLGMYWPIWDPMPQISRKKPSVYQTELTRSQLIYVSSPAMANYVAGELHRTRPAWLASNAESKYSHDQSSGWQLKARVVY